MQQNAALPRCGFTASMAPCQSASKDAWKVPWREASALQCRPVRRHIPHEVRPEQCGKPTKPHLQPQSTLRYIAENTARWQNLHRAQASWSVFCASCIGVRALVSALFRPSCTRRASVCSASRCATTPYHVCASRRRRAYNPVCVGEMRCAVDAACAKRRAQRDGASSTRPQRIQGLPMHV
jgi:hypothetical protein